MNCICLTHFCAECSNDKKIAYTNEEECLEHLSINHKGIFGN
jgi:hypothetical protein